MKTAVIYARYSSGKQREVSIDDQLRIVREYLSRENIREVRAYYDKAKSGRTDRRPSFQEMIANAPESDYVVVYAMDRFSRDRWDAPVYKKLLSDAGVRVLSATEQSIDDSPEGVLQEKLLEGMAAYYSLNLARSVRRGMTGNALACKVNGYKLLGYDIDPETRRYVLNETEADVVRDVFSRYVAGATINSLAEELAAAGYKTRNGTPMSANAVKHMLHNERYLGIYKWGDVVVPGGMPQIVSKAMFDAAQNAAHGRQSLRKELYVFEDFRLTGKLFCGLCGEAMVGTSGHGRHGKKYSYYRCTGKDRKPIRKELVEDALAESVTRLMDEPRTARLVAERIVAAYVGDDKADAALQACEAHIRENETAVHNIEKAVEKGIITDGLKDRLDELQAESRRLHSERGRLLTEQMNLDVDELAEFIQHGFDVCDDDLIFGGFVNRVYLFEDYMVAIMNYRNEMNELDEVIVALEKEKVEPPEGFDQNGYGGPKQYLSEPLLIPLRHGFGLIIQIAA